MLDTTRSSSLPPSDMTLPHLPCILGLLLAASSREKFMTVPSGAWTLRSTPVRNVAPSPPDLLVCLPVVTSLRLARPSVATLQPTFSTLTIRLRGWHLW